MNTDKILPGLIVLTVAIFAGMGFVAHLYVIAVYALAFGLIWLVLTLRKIWALSTVLFVLFLGLAIWGCLDNLPIAAMVLGLVMALAAWDLSRFRSRIAGEESAERIAALETRHLRSLLATVSAGFAAALVPLFANLSVSFLGVAAIALVAMLVLRQSIRSIRRP